MPIHQIKHSNPKLDKIIHQIDDGDYKIPAFQRGFVWKLEQVLELLDSIYLDYPIGTILLWNTKTVMKYQRNLGGFELPKKEDEYPVNYVLDGQQRLSTLYAVFGTNTELAKEHSDLGVDPKLFDVYFDMDDIKFVHGTSVNSAHKNLQLKGLFDAMTFTKRVRDLEEKYLKIATEMYSRFNNYEIQMITTEKREKGEVGIIFERINNTGTKLSTLNLMIAWTWDEDFHLKEAIDDFLEDLEEKSFGALPDKIILQCLGAIISKKTGTKDILALPASEVKDNFSKLEESLKRTVDFFSTQFNMQSEDFLPHVQQIVGLTYFFSKVTTPSVTQAAMLKQWFWKTSFSDRYSGQTDDKMNADIVFMDKVIANDARGVGSYSYTIKATDLVEERFSKATPLTRALLLLLAQKPPLDMTNGNLIDLGKALSTYNRKEYHHIFPEAYLRGIKVPIDKITSLCNFCFLPADSNKRISKKEPAEYVFKIIPKESYKKVLDSNIMPLKKDIYEKNDYAVFLAERSQLILSFLDTLTV